MADFKLKWDQTGERLYETGVDRGVVYPQVAGAYPAGAAWNGLTGVTLSPSGAEPSPLYANNHKYLNYRFHKYNVLIDYIYKIEKFSKISKL